MKRRLFPSLCVTLATFSATFGRAADAPSSVSTNAPFPVSIRVDAAKPMGPLRPIWRFFGADEPNYATMKNGQKLIGELGELAPKQVYFRAHNLLTSGDGTPAMKIFFSFLPDGACRSQSSHAAGRDAHVIRLRDTATGDTATLAIMPATGSVLVR